MGGEPQLTYLTWDQNGMNLLRADGDLDGTPRSYVHGYTAVDGIGSMVAADDDNYDYYPVYDHRGAVSDWLDADGNVSSSRVVPVTGIMRRSSRSTAPA